MKNKAKYWIVFLKRVEANFFQTIGDTCPHQSPANLGPPDISKKGPNQGSAQVQIEKSPKDGRLINFEAELKENAAQLI